MPMKVRDLRFVYAPVPEGASWLALVERDTTTLDVVTVVHADLPATGDLNDDPGLKRLEAAVYARALDLLEQGRGTRIGGSVHKTSLATWELAGSARAREALEYHSSRYPTETPQDGGEGQAATGEADLPTARIDGVALICTVCGARDQIYEEDRAVRRNDLEVQDGGVSVHLSGTDFVHQGYFCGACGREVSLPVEPDYP